jgi:hypothetical protein
MGRIVKLLLLCAVFVSCAPVAEITGSWKTPRPLSRDYNTILVSSLNSDVIARSRVESDMANSLSKYGVRAIKSIDEFPPNIKNDSLDKETIMMNVKNNNIDGILTVALLRKETVSRYVPGNYPYPVSRFGYYGNFWGYYSYWHPYAYSPGYYEQNDIYYFEINLYDARTEDLIWSAQSETYDPRDLYRFSKEFSEVITSKMKADGVIKGNPVVGMRYSN